MLTNGHIYIAITVYCNYIPYESFIDKQLADKLIIMQKDL
jgi:hypothetical protein